MKIDKTSVLALGLAGTASANWNDWSSSSTPADSSKTSSSSSSYDPSTWADWSSSSTPADSSKTSKSYDPSHTWADWESKTLTTPAGSEKTVTVTATTTVYRSTVFVGPGDCAAPTGAKPVSDDSDAPAAPDADSAAPSGSWGTPAAPVSDASGTPAGNSPVSPSSGSGSGSWGPGSGSDDSDDTPDADSTTGGASGPAPTGWEADAGISDGKLHVGISSASVVATNSEVFTWKGGNAPQPTVSAAPTYAGWGDWTGEKGGGSNGTGPAPGTDKANVTKPFEPLSDTSGCNSASDRSKWCGKYSIDTDYYKEAPSTGKTCSYNFEITNTTLNYDGLDRLALAINGQVPGPLIECNWGDMVSVTITNKLQNNATTIHWHGITQQGTNDQDGVPGITECAIAPGSSRTYSFKANQYGTGWYHSHVLSQYGDGVRGPMVIHGPATANYDVDAGTVMIDDLFGSPNAPMTVATTNALIAHFGPGGTSNYMLNGANTSPDLSKGKHAFWKVESGKKYRFRFINSASQNMWSVHFDNHKMTVIATDYVPIVPYTTEWLNIGIGQRYDVIVEMNQPKAGYFLRAVTQTGCPSGCANDGLGKANGIFVYDDVDAVLPNSTFTGKTPQDFAICADEPLASLVPHLKKSAGTSSAFSASASTIPGGLVAAVNTPDDGTVFRWFLNNGAINVDFAKPTLQNLASGAPSNASSNSIVLSSKGQWVYFVIQNQFFAGHPMHLHGHDMSVLGQGTTAWNPSLTNTLNFNNPTRRDTAMLAGSRGPGFPPGYTVIGFETDNPGAWLMHCHIIWHVDGGLALQWIERPDDITTSKYVNSDFKSECSSLSAYQSANPAHVKPSGSSGLKARTYFDRLVDGTAFDAVRHEKSFVRRSIGDGSRMRHGLRK